MSSEASNCSGSRGPQPLFEMLADTPPIRLAGYASSQFEHPPGDFLIKILVPVFIAETCLIVYVKNLRYKEPTGQTNRKSYN